MRAGKWLTIDGLQPTGCGFNGFRIQSAIGLKGCWFDRAWIIAFCLRFFPSTIFWHLASGILLLFLTSCYEDREGCLDINATNFNVEADIACVDCCTYPALQLDFQHKVVLADTVLNLSYVDSTYRDGFGNPFRISNIQYYLSGFHLIRTGGDTLQVADTLQITKSDGETITIKDDFLLVNPGVFGFESLGTFRTEGDYAGIGFNFGIGPVANQLDTTYFEEDHPLSAQNPNMYLGNEGYAFAKIDLLLNPANDSLTTEIIINGDKNLIPVDILSDFNLLEGINPRFILFVNYLEWFNNVDVINDTPEMMNQKIASQLANSFALLEIQIR